MQDRLTRSVMRALYASLLLALFSFLYGGIYNEIIKGGTSARSGVPAQVPPKPSAERFALTDARARP